MIKGAAPSCRYMTVQDTCFSQLRTHLQPQLPRIWTPCMVQVVAIAASPEAMPLRLQWARVGMLLVFALLAGCLPP
jgi:hypothetical protein